MLDTSFSNAPQKPTSFEDDLATIAAPVKARTFEDDLADIAAPARRYPNPVQGGDETFGPVKPTTITPGEMSSHKDWTAQQAVKQFAPAVPVTPDDPAFTRWYAGMAATHNLNPDPDAPEQFYDYRAAFRAGATPDATGHWPSDFKKPGHPNMVVGGFNVQTGERVSGTPRANEQELLGLGWSPEEAKRLSRTPEPATERFDPETGTFQPKLMTGAGTAATAAADYVVGGAVQAGRGLSEATRIAGALPQPPRYPGAPPVLAQTVAGQPMPTTGEILNAGSDAIEGSFRLLTPVVVAAGVAAPVATAAMLALASGSAKGAEWAVEQLGGTPEAQRFVGNLAAALVGARQGREIAKDVLGRLKTEAQAVVIATKLAGEPTLPKGGTSPGSTGLQGTAGAPAFGEPDVFPKSPYTELVVKNAPKPETTLESVKPEVKPAVEPAKPAQTFEQSLAEVAQKAPERLPTVAEVNAAYRPIGETSVTPAPAVPVDTLGGFVDAMIPLAQSRVRKALGGSVTNGGRAISRQALVEEKVANGATVIASRSGERRLQTPDGAYLAESQISKLGMDYAEHLLAQKPTEQPIPAPPAPEAVQAVPAPVQAVEAVPAAPTEAPGASSPALSVGQPVQFTHNGETLAGTVAEQHQGGAVVVKATRPDGSRVMRLLKPDQVTAVEAKAEEAPALAELRAKAAQVLVDTRGFHPLDAAKYAADLGGEKQLVGFLQDNTPEALAALEAEAATPPAPAVPAPVQAQAAEPVAPIVAKRETAKRQFAEKKAAKVQPAPLASAPKESKPRERIIDAYMNETVDYGGESMTRAERRRRLLASGLSEREADNYELGTQARPKPAESVITPSVPPPITGLVARKEAVVRAGTLKPTKAKAGKPAQKPEAAAEVVVNQVERVVDTQGAASAAEVQKRVLATLESAKEGAAQAAGFREIEYRAGKAYGGREGSVWVDGDMVAMVDRYGAITWPSEASAYTTAQGKYVPAVESSRGKLNIGSQNTPSEHGRLATQAVAKALASERQAGRLVVQVPGDGKFIIEHNPYTIARVMELIVSKGRAMWADIAGEAPKVQTTKQIIQGIVRESDAEDRRTGDAGRKKLAKMGLGESAVAEAPEEAPAKRGGGSANASIGAVADTSPVTNATRPEPAENDESLRARRVSGPVPPQADTDIRPVEFPELVALARELQTTPRVVKGFLGNPKFGTFSADGIKLLADLFKPGQERQLAATLAHEIGHLVDWLPDQTLKRGNILGRLKSLQSFLKHTFTAADGHTIKVGEVRAELLALSKEWRPWDEATSPKSFNDYRKSSKELYADALSVLLNNPGMLSQKAPIFYQQFFEQLDAKPDVRRAYEDLQDVLAGTPEALVARRRSGVRQMFEAGDTKALDIEQRRQDEAKAKKRNLWFRLKTHLVDRNYAVIDRVNALEKQGIQIPEDEDPRYLLEERNYLGGKLKGFADRAFSPVFDTLREAGLSWTDFGEALFYERIIAGDRSEIANPRGLSVKTAQELYDTLKTDLGPEKTAILTNQMVTFRSGLKEAAENAYQAGLYTDEQHALMQANPAYVTFQVLDHLEDRLTSRVYRQIGTLKDIANPADASILKTLATIRATERNRMIRGVVDFLHKQFPQDIQPARTKWNGKTQEPVESKDPNQHLIEYYEKGKRAGVYVDEYLAGAINKETIGRNLAPLELLRAINAGFFRPVFTTFNLGFQSFNVVRDLLRTWKNAPGMSLGRLLSRYKQAVPLAKARAFDEWTDQSQADLVAAEEAGILSVTFNDLIAGRDVEDSQIEDILTRLGVQGYQAKRHAPAYQFLLSALGAIRNTGDFIETLPKAAMIYEYRGEGAIADISPAKRSFIRRKIGSPDFLAGGTAKPITNELFLFSNAITQALRSDVEVATDPTTRAGFWWKTATLNLIPKILMFAAIMGAFGETVRRLMQKSTEYDRTNYTVLPLGEDANGNAVYIRLPQDDIGRILGGLLWKMLRAGIGDQDALKTLAQVADYSVGVFPSVTPTVELLQQSAQFAAGQNPYDTFRGRNIFTDDEWKARDWNTAKKFIGWEFQQLGGGVVWKFQAGGDRPTQKTVEQKIIELPVVSNVAGRFIRITNYGETESLRGAQDVASRADARQRMSEREAVNDALKGYLALPPEQRTQGKVRAMSNDVAKTLYADPKERADRTDNILARMKMGVQRGKGDPLTDAVMTATSNDQKVAVIVQAGKTMAPTDLQRWVSDALRNKVISTAVSRELRAKGLLQ